jgi:hypothetical protein
MPILHPMTMKLKPIALSLLLVGGCEEKQKETANAALPAPQQDAPVVSAPKQKEKIRLTISEMGIDNHGFLQLRVHTLSTFRGSSTTKMEIR